MRIYETTFIINPQTDDASIDRGVRSVSDLITSNGGKIIHEDRMGTRRLAYPIKGLTQGYYTAFIFEGTDKILPALDRHFKLGEAYIRHLTILYEGELGALSKPEEVKAPAELDKEKETAPAEVKALTRDKTELVDAGIESDQVEKLQDEPEPESVEIKDSVEADEPSVSKEEEEEL